MQEPPVYSTPATFLEAVARHLHILPEQVPSARALDELLGWMEAQAAVGQPAPVPFLIVALRLVYEHTRLATGPTTGEVFALVERLQAENHSRPQAERWQGADWLQLARLLLDQRKLPLVALFSDHPPTPEAVVREIPLPYAARHVEKPLRFGARRIPTADWERLCDRAEQYIAATRRDLDEVHYLLSRLDSGAKRTRER